MVERRRTDQQQLVNTIKAHIAKGDQAQEKADQAQEKAQQHYIAAGQHLLTLKPQHGGSWKEWEELLRTKIGIGKSSDLMQIADGRKTVDQVQQRSNESSNVAHKKRRQISSPLISGEQDDSAADMKAKFAAMEEEPIKEEEEEEDGEAGVLPEHYENAFYLRVAEVIRCAVYSGPITENIIIAAGKAAEAWSKLAASLGQRRDKAGA